MKFSLIVIAFLTTFYVNSQYISFLDDINKWSVDTYYCPWNPSDPIDPWTETDVNEINGTVEIDGLIYKQIYRDGEPYCLLREESGVLYKYFTSGERVMFDMNFEIGDTYSMINSAFENPYCSGYGTNIGIYYIEVFDIETLYIAGADRKVIKFVDQWYPNQGEVSRWIEGIGTLAGLGLTWQFWDITCGNALACFETNGVSYFMNGATSCDNTTLGVGDLSKDRMILYPNPVTDRSILQFSNETIIDHINIYDISGKLIKEESISRDYFMIDAMQYPSGLYFYQVFSEGQLIASDKFIVK